MLKDRARSGLVGKPSHFQEVKETSLLQDRNILKQTNELIDLQILIFK